MADANPENPQARRQERPDEEVAKRIQPNMPQEAPEAQRTIRINLSRVELEEMAESALFGPSPDDT
jgi:hypothetical protein